MKCKIFILNLILINLIIVSCSTLQRSSIIGGTDASKHQFPYFVSVEFNDEHLCGGTIITSEIILTAAHCVCLEDTFELIESEYFRIRAGTIEREKNGQIIQVSKIYVHPLYNRKGIMEYDIALLKLELPIIIDGDSTYPIKLARQNYRLPKESYGTICGWGLEEPNSLYEAEILKFATVKIFNDKDCYKFYKSNDFNISRETTLCAGYLDGTIDTCHSDSGGPLIIGNGYDSKQIGIVSAGADCAEIGLPGLYTDIGKLRYWLDDMITDIILRKI